MLKAGGLPTRASAAAAATRGSITARIFAVLAGHCDTRCKAATAAVAILHTLTQSTELVSKVVPMHAERTHFR